MWNKWVLKSATIKEKTLRLNDQRSLDTSDDRIIYQQHWPSLEFSFYWIKFETNFFLAKGLARHNEGTPNITIFDEALSIWLTQCICALQGYSFLTQRKECEIVSIRKTTLPMKLKQQVKKPNQPEVLDVSGIGITTSISWSLNSLIIFFASLSPMFSRDW